MSPIALINKLNNLMLEFNYKLASSNVITFLQMCPQTWLKSIFKGGIWLPTIFP